MLKILKMQMTIVPLSILALPCLRKSHYSEAKTPKAREMTSLVELVLLTVEPISTEI